MKLRKLLGLRDWVYIYFICLIVTLFTSSVEVSELPEGIHSIKVSASLMSVIILIFTVVVILIVMANIPIKYRYNIKEKELKALTLFGYMYVCSAHGVKILDAIKADRIKRKSRIRKLFIDKDYKSDFVYY